LNGVPGWPQARQHFAPDGNSERLQGRRRCMIFRGDQFERPYRDVAAQAVTARDLPIELTETRVKIGTARYRSASRSAGSPNTGSP